MTNKYFHGVQTLALAGISSALLLSTQVAANDQTTVAAKDQTKTRVGTCEDAKAQTKYWCEEREQVTVVSFGMECENAKKNAEEACNGVVEEDKPYKFDGTGTKKDN